MNGEDLIRRLAVALAIGLLVGAERHWREREDAPGRRTAGLRTFALTGLAGGVFAALAAPAGPLGGAVLLSAGLFAMVAALLPFALREGEAEERYSATGMVAAVGTFALGALAVAGQVQAAGAAAVAMTAVLALREQLHGFMKRLTWVELRSAILLLSMTLVALPLVPDAPIAWLAGVNPRKVWTLAILLAGISFLGYLAVKLGGVQRGLLLAGAAGGLISSTAVTLSNASASAKGGSSVHGLAAGALVSGVVSCLRTLALVVLVAPTVVGALWLPLAATAAGMGAVAGLLALRRDGPAENAASAANPFEIGAVLRMAVLLGAVGAAARFAAERLGGAAVILVAAVTGLTDVDAITLSVPALAPETITPALAAQAVMAAVASNVIAKTGYALAWGGRRFGGFHALGSLAGLALGGAALLV